MPPEDYLKQKNSQKNIDQGSTGSANNFFNTLDTVIQRAGNTGVNIIQTKNAFDALKDGVNNNPSGFNYSGNILGNNSGDGANKFIAQEEFIADSFVNSVGRQSERIGSTLLNEYGLYIIGGIGAYLLLRRGAA